MGLGGEGWGSDQSETQGTVRGPWLGSETLAGLRDVALTRVRMGLGGEGWGWIFCPSRRLAPSCETCAAWERECSTRGRREACRAGREVEMGRDVVRGVR